MMQFLRQLVLFSRPHTIVGTSLSLLALYLLALDLGTNTSLHLFDFGMAWLACIGANIYIVGLNQLTDIPIDKINKPYLPLASGAWSKSQAQIVISFSLLVALSISLYYQSFLLLTVTLSLILGTAYSLPPFRLKRFYFWAAFCIIAVRGLIANLFLFLHFHWLINQQTVIPFEIWLLAGIIFAFSIVIAWFKDIPDMDGDASHQINTLSIRLGARRVFFLGNLILTAAILISILLSIYQPLQVSNSTLIIGQSLLLLILWANNWWNTRHKRAFQVIKTWFPKYYQFIWLLFFVEYLIFVFATI